MVGAFRPQHDPDIVLRSPFDYKTHNETFKDYCEVVILKDGAIEYGVPSHIEKVKQVYRDMFGSDPDEDCPKSFYANYLEWLCIQTESVVVWTNMHTEPFNRRQEIKLRQLQMHGCCNFADR